ncbi:MAG: NUDIX hydrolase [Syntrophothermus sp.]
MESFAIPGVGGIIEKNIAGTDYILIQERCKTDAPAESGLIEIPAGKIRKYENIFDCLRREIWEETGLEVTEIYGEAEAKLIQSQGYKVLSYKPFSCAKT